MIAFAEGAAGMDRHADQYYVSGYRDIAAFLAAAKDLDLKLFDTDAEGVTGDGVTQKERRHGKRGLMRWIMQSLAAAPLDYFEFGVMDCKTFNRVLTFVPHPGARFYGFDTFGGLPEPWVCETEDDSVGLRRDAGELAPVNPPAVYDARAVLYKGLFQDTLPEALERAFPAGRDPERRLFLNIDSDLYTSALYALTSMHLLLRDGDLVYFDEFFDAMNEFAAFNDYIRAYNSKAWFVPIARSYDGMLFRIEMPPADAARTAIIDRRTTHFLDRMRAYARTRVSLLKSADPGR